MSECKACGHEHTGDALGRICIGCPCAERPDNGRRQQLAVDRGRVVVVDLGKKDDTEPKKEQP